MARSIATFDVLCATGPERKARRIELGITQAKLAAVLDIRIDTIRGWESGVTPSAALLPAYVEILTNGLETQ